MASIATINPLSQKIIEVFNEETLPQYRPLYEAIKNNDVERVGTILAGEDCPALAYERDNIISIVTYPIFQNKLDFFQIAMFEYLDPRVDIKKEKLKIGLAILQKFGLLTKSAKNLPCFIHMLEPKRFLIPHEGETQDVKELRALVEELFKTFLLNGASFDNQDHSTKQLLPNFFFYQILKQSGMSAFFLPIIEECSSSYKELVRKSIKKLNLNLIDDIQSMIVDYVSVGFRMNDINKAVIIPSEVLNANCITGAVTKKFIYDGIPPRSPVEFAIRRGNKGAVPFLIRLGVSISRELLDSLEPEQRNAIAAHAAFLETLR